jgi:hypothetical protein
MVFIPHINNVYTSKRSMGSIIANKTQFPWCSTIIHQAIKLQMFASFLPPKMLQPLIMHILSRFIYARLFSVPEVENEFKRTPLCG